MRARSSWFQLVAMCIVLVHSAEAQRPPTPGDTVFACYNRTTGTLINTPGAGRPVACHPRSESRLIVGIIDSDRRNVGLSAFRGRFQTIAVATAFQEALPQLDKILQNAELLVPPGELPVPAGNVIPIAVGFPAEPQAVHTIVMREVALDLRLKGVLFTDTNRYLDNPVTPLPIVDLTSSQAPLALGSPLGFRPIDSVPGYIGALTGALPVSTVMIPEVVVTNWKVYSDDGRTELDSERYRIVGASSTDFSAVIVPPIQELTTSLTSTVYYRVRASVRLKLGPDCSDPETTTCTDPRELEFRIPIYRIGVPTVAVFYQHDDFSGAELVMVPSNSPVGSNDQLRKAAGDALEALGRLKDAVAFMASTAGSPWNPLLPNLSHLTSAVGQLPGSAVFRRTNTLNTLNGIEMVDGGFWDIGEDADDFFDSLIFIGVSQNVCAYSDEHRDTSYGDPWFEVETPADKSQIAVLIDNLDSSLQSIPPGRVHEHGDNETFHDVISSISFSC